MTDLQLSAYYYCERLSPMEEQLRWANMGIPSMDVYKGSPQMTNEKDREMPRCTLSDEELADKLSEWAIKLAKTGGKAWGLRVPVDLNHDPDILMIEAADRVRILAEAVEAEREMLRPYCHHENECGYWIDDGPCTCGLAAILSDDQEAARG